MPKKIYRTFWLKSLDLHFTGEDGRPIEVVFRGGIQIDSTAKFSTSDEDLQKKIEASSLFNQDFYLESEVATEEEKKAAEKATAKPVEPVAEEPITLMIDQKTFRNIQEMRAAMAEYFAEEELAKKNYAALLKLCKEKGLDFTIVKDK